VHVLHSLVQFLLSVIALAHVEVLFNEAVEIHLKLLDKLSSLVPDLDECKELALDVGEAHSKQLSVFADRAEDVLGLAKVAFAGLTLERAKQLCC